MDNHPHICIKGNTENPNTSDINELIQWVEKQDGEFGIISLVSSTYFAAVDRVRSYPVFYTFKNKRIHLAFDIQDLITDEISRESISEKYVREFLHSGFVMGSNTLFDNIFQLEAGEYLFFSNGELVIKSYLNNPFFSEKWDESPTKMVNKHQDTLESIFDDVIQKIGTSQVIIPLSGGFDSRMILKMLKEGGVNSILTFTFGSTDSREAEIAKKIANYLGVKWIYWNESFEKWNTIRKDESLKRYLIKASNYSSLAVVQEFFAIRPLLEKADSDDLFFIPGHSGDFLQGSHLPIWFENVNEERVLEAIMKKFFRFWNPDVQFIKDRLSKHGKYVNLLKNSSDALAWLEWFNLAERQAKIIVNANRQYDFFGCKWLNPLWDRRYVEYWAHVPYKWRYGRRLFKQEIVKTWREELQIEEKIVRNPFLKIKDVLLNPKWGRFFDNRLQLLVNNPGKQHKQLSKRFNLTHTPIHNLHLWQFNILEQLNALCENINNKDV